MATKVRLICNEYFWELLEELKRLKIVLPQYNLDRSKIIERIKELEKQILEEVSNCDCIIDKE